MCREERTGPFRGTASFPLRVSEMSPKARDFDALRTRKEHMWGKQV